MLLVFIVTVSHALAGERTIVSLRDFEQTELKTSGFTLSSDQKVRINAVGGGYIDKVMNFSDGQLYSYGWIIDADTRKLVWSMDVDNTKREKDDRRFDGEVSLNKGSYEVYFAAYGFAMSSPFSSFNFNVDRRKKDFLGSWGQPHGLFSWLQGFFGGDPTKEWRRRSKLWGIELSVSDDGLPISTFDPPKELARTMYKATKLGERERVKQAFTIKKPVSLKIYALGESSGDEPNDYGWIVNTKTHKRMWEMNSDNLRPAGGAEKNVKLDDVISFAAGEYVLYYITDDSHSFLDWNAAPPNDPYNYGITLMATKENDNALFELSKIEEDKNVVVQLIGVSNDETRSDNFTLKNNASLHIYAIGERGNSRHQMADYGWIFNTKTREKVWMMDVENTEHAGGTEKNRMIDEVITLPKGTYTAFYKTDDSHAFGDWNDTPPMDADHYGITITGEGDNFNMKDVVKSAAETESDIIAQIIHVGDDANTTRSFSIDKQSHVRLYAIGEGQNREMFDYGWIENASNGSVVWEMTYGMTFHAGGGRKNRMVNTTILLDKGTYKLHYVSDNSHSYNDWNTDSPDDPTMWGITISREE